MDRRDLLRTSSVVLAAGFAGCSGVLDGGDGGDGSATADGTTTATGTSTPTGTTGRAAFDVTLTAGGPTRVGTDLSVRVTATNTGTRPGSFSDTLRVNGSTTRTFPVTIDDVPPDAQRSTTVSFAPSYAGAYTATLADRDASLDLRVVPVTETGSAVAVDEDLELAVESVGVEPAVFVRGPGWGYQRDPVSGIVGSELDDPSDWFVAVIRGRVENTSTTATTFDPDLVTLRADSSANLPLYDEDTLQTGVPLSDARLPGGAINLSKATVPPGESLTGFLMAPVNRYLVETSVAAVVQRDDRGMPEAAWRNVPSGGQRGLPTFEVRDLTVPDEVEIGAEREFSVTVANVGGAAGRFRGLLQDRIVDDKHTPLGTVEGRVPAGETKRLTGTMVCPWSRERDVVLYPSGERTTIQARKATRAYGETCTMPNGVTVKVFSPIYSHFVEYGEDKNWSHGMWTVGVEAEIPESVRGKKRGKELLPAATDFRCYRHEERLRFSDPLRVSRSNANRNAENNDNALEYPVVGDLYPVEPPEDPPNGTVGGWLTFTVGPEEYHFSLERLEVQLLRNVFGEYDHFKTSWSKKYETA